MTAANVIAANLGHLQHPNGGIVAIPGFDRHAKSHPELAEAHGALALHIGEAIVHTLQVNGHPVDDGTAAPPEPEDPWITLRCNRCRTPLARINTANPQHVITNPDQLATALTNHSKECQ
jgi:hypothetical protein